MSAAKIVIITGASRGLGLCLAQAFLRSTGWRVIGVGRSPRPTELPEAVEYHQFDASSALRCQEFWQTITGLPSASVTLINNAGGYIGESFGELSPDDFEKQMNMNFFPAVYMTRTLADVVDAARVFTIISSAAYEPSAKNTAYGASKAAEKYLFQALQKETKTSKFKVTNVYPGDIATQGPSTTAIDPSDLALLIRDMTEYTGSYYVRDITLSVNNQ